MVEKICDGPPTPLYFADSAIVGGNTGAYYLWSSFYKRDRKSFGRDNHVFNIWDTWVIEYIDIRMHAFVTDGTNHRNKKGAISNFASCAPRLSSRMPTWAGDDVNGDT